MEDSWGGEAERLPVALAVWIVLQSDCGVTDRSFAVRSGALAAVCMVVELDVAAGGGAGVGRVMSALGAESGGICLILPSSDEYSADGDSCVIMMPNGLTVIACRCRCSCSRWAEWGVDPPPFELTLLTLTLPFNDGDASVKFDDFGDVITSGGGDGVGATKSCVLVAPLN